MGNFVFQDLDVFPKTVWREGDPPFVNGAPPIVAEDDDPSPAGSSRRRGLFRLWLIVFFSIHLAVAWTLLTAPELAQEYCTSPLQPIAAICAPLLLWTITVLIWRWAHKTGDQP